MKSASISQKRILYYRNIIDTWTRISLKLYRLPLTNKGGQWNELPQKAIHSQTKRQAQKSMKCDDTNDLWRRKDETPHQFWHNGEDSPDESNMCNFLALFYLIVGTLIKGRNLFRVWNLHQFPMILIQVLLLVLLIVPSHRWRISPTKQITIGVSNLFKKGS